MPGLDGLVKMKKLMDERRGNPPKEIAGVEVFKLRDYSDGSIKVPELGVMGQNMPPSTPACFCPTKVAVLTAITPGVH